MIKDGHVLATQRGHGASAGGWEFPGGKVEPGETPEAALRREIQEELGAPITVLAHLVTIDHADPASRVTLHCYHATLDGPYELTEHRSARWLDATTLNTVAWL
ncbi:MAG: (deoxy)nucleoside triphosphate pyrophosphohydrolase, partial [Propionibacteriaceae bacterium]|nr:(deoxy)nucleoside triphosphate pyrophosphohydrolase [Propionibacteriaceae bacterium]